MIFIFGLHLHKNKIQAPECPIIPGLHSCLIPPGAIQLLPLRGKDGLNFMMDFPPEAML